MVSLYLFVVTSDPVIRRTFRERPCALRETTGLARVASSVRSRSKFNERAPGLDERRTSRRALYARNYRVRCACARTDASQERRRGSSLSSETRARDTAGFLGEFFFKNSFEIISGDARPERREIIRLFLNRSCERTPRYSLVVDEQSGFVL